MASSERAVVTVPSLGDQSYRILRDMITSSELAPGERVTERGLAARLGVSPTPIREAISRLTHERLLLRVDGRTLQVATPSLRHLREMSLISAALEGVAARLAAQYASKEELDEIARAHRASLPGAADAGHGDGRKAEARMRHEFHELIAAASRNQSLIDMIATAEAFGRPLRLRAQFSEGAAESIQRAVDEHEEIIAALRARDGERAERLVTAHTLWITERYLAFAEDQGLVVAD
jgi:DNA-binding GntR family transcriptional regulator